MWCLSQHTYDPRRARCPVRMPCLPKVDWLPGESWRSRQGLDGGDEGGEQGDLVVDDPGCVSSSPTSRAVPDGRFRDGRLLYINE